MVRRKRRRCAGISALVTGAALKSCHAWINATPQAYAAHAARVQTVEKGRSVHGGSLSSITRLAVGESQDSKDGLIPSSTFSPLLLASATGIFTGAIVVALNDFVHLLQDFLLELPGGLAAVAPVLSASLVSLLLFLRGPKGLSGDSELAQLKASGGVPSADASEAPLRALAAGLTLAGGNSLGPESPSVEIGANVAANLAGAQTLKESEVDKAFRNNLLAAGCASGIAAGFNAPVAGLFFALESVQSNYGPEEARERGPPMQLLAAVLAATVSQLGLGSSPAVDLEFFGWVPARSLWELPFFILLGLLCGLVAAALRYMRQLGKKTFAAAEDAGCPKFLFPIVAGIIVAIVTFSDSTKEVLYKGFANVNLVLDYADGGKQPPSLTGDPLLHLLILLICKIFLTAICQSSGQVGGLFAPALFMGACIGGLSGRALRDNFWPWAINLPDFGLEKAFSVPATYAVVGMAACLGSICGVPLTSVVLLLELSGGKDYGVVLPTVAATGVAVYVELLCKSPEKISALRKNLTGAFSPGADAPAEATLIEAEGPKRRSVLCAIPPGRVELSPGSAATVVPSCLLLEEARDELLLLGSGGCLAVVEESNETGDGKNRSQRLLGVVSLVDVDKALGTE